MKLQQLQAYVDAERGRNRYVPLRYRVMLDLLAEVAFNGATPKRSLESSMAEEPVAGGIPRYSSGHAESMPPTYSSAALRRLKTEEAYLSARADTIEDFIASLVDKEQREHGRRP